MYYPYVLCYCLPGQQSHQQAPAAYNAGYQHQQQPSGGPIANGGFNNQPPYA
ncbi:hypothetical protein BofuT4_P160970.1 [Botrytis cinerea T4]|uniref:Uncharacterized protein n=1 Tax=Botryotinia fuckeliana (strain T4) TaxID=999810 RepID=G2YTP8_BOTF4|nr:hypothetical protein BofuT4_P160970.1 [Botrytis cinerea T4]